MNTNTAPWTSKINRLLIGHSWRASHGWAMALIPGANQYIPHIQHQSLFYGGWRHNYYCQLRQAGRASEQSTYLDVYALPIFIICLPQTVCRFICSSVQTLFSAPWPPQHSFIHFSPIFSVCCFCTADRASIGPPLLITSKNVPKTGLEPKTGDILYPIPRSLAYPFLLTTHNQW